MDADDIGVAQARTGECLLAKAVRENQLVRGVGMHDLQGQRAGQPLVLDQPDRPHAPGRYALAQCIAPAEDEVGLESLHEISMGPPPALPDTGEPRARWPGVLGGVRLVWPERRARADGVS